MIESAIAKRKNGFHDFVENRGRELETLLRFHGYDVVRNALARSPLPTVSDYEASIPESNILLREQVAEARSIHSSREKEINETINKLNNAQNEVEFRAALETFKTLAE